MTPTPSNSAHFLALGDSYTIGQGVLDSERWPVQLAARLNELGISMAEPEIIARTGWTSADLLRNLANGTQREIYDLVSVLIGVNDQYVGIPVDEYKPNLQELLRQAIALAGGDPQRVIVLSIPDWGVTPFAAGRDADQIAVEIDAFNAVNYAEAQAMGLHYFDVTAISRRAGIESSLITGDGLHPSGIMYAEWVDIVLPYVQELLAP
jgi:lysophospholipase L1-like esterase